MHRVGVRQCLHDQRVAGLVVGDDFFLAVGDAPALALRAGDDASDGLLELEHANHFLVGASGEDRGLVDQVGKVRAAEARSLAGEDVEVDRRVERLVARVYVEDLPAALDVRPVEGHVAVETTRPKKGGVEDVWPVGGRDDDDVGVGVESIHLDQQLIQGLLTLVVTAAEPGPALAADGVDLINEDDAGRVLLGLVEQVADATRAHTDEHLDELRARDGEERHTRFARNRLAEQGFPGPGRTHEEHALGNARTQGNELFGVLEELDDLGELLFRFIDSGHVGKGDGRLVAGDHSRSGASE